MKIFRINVQLLLLLACVAAVYAVSKPAVEKILPVKGDVTGFTVVSGSLQYGKGDDITKIYNGGYELYTKNGVVDAARQMYQRKNDYVEVTTHTMKSSKAAMDFLKYWQKENKVKTLTKTKTSTGFTVTKPSVMAYYVTGKYFTTVSAFYAADKAQKDTKAFVTAIEKKIAKLNTK